MRGRCGIARRDTYIGHAQVFVVVANRSDMAVQVCVVCVVPCRWPGLVCWDVLECRLGWL